MAQPSAMMPCPVCRVGFAPYLVSDHIHRFHVGSNFPWKCGQCG